MEENVWKILEITGFFDELYKPIYNSIVDNGVEISWEEFEEYFNKKALFGEIILPLYMEKFTCEEIQEIKDFYTSEMGVKLLDLNFGNEEYQEKASKWLQSRVNRLLMDKIKF